MEWKERWKFQRKLGRRLGEDQRMASMEGERERGGGICFTSRGVLLAVISPRGESAGVVDFEAFD